MLKIAVIDDIEQERQSFCTLLTDYLKEKSPLFSGETQCFSSGEAFMETFAPQKYDLVFLDIYMKQLDGIETARRIRASDEQVSIIFTTYSNDFASESYEVRASCYLLKPYTKAGVFRMLDQIDISSYEAAQVISLPGGIRLVLQNVIYTEFYKRGVLIHQKIGEDLHIRISQSDFEAYILKEPAFITCSKGLVVNLNQVQQLFQTNFTMTDGSLVPVSRRKMAEVKKTYSEFLFQKIRNEVKK